MAKPRSKTRTIRLDEMPSLDWIRSKCVIDVHGCWMWKGRSRAKYCTISLKSGPRMAHRVAYIAAKGQIQEGLEIDHLCMIKCCCNPDHLEAVTPAENNRRARTWQAEERREEIRSMYPEKRMEPSGIALFIIESTLKDLLKRSV